jgi:hypothetical protein
MDLRFIKICCIFLYDEVIKKELAYARTVADDDKDKIKSVRIEAINKVVAKYMPLEDIEIAVKAKMKR